MTVPTDMHPDTPAPPRRRTGLVIAIAAGAVALVAASVAITAALLHDPATPQPAAAATAAAVTTTSAAAPTTPAAPTTAAAPSPTPAARKFGEKADGPQLSATAYAYKQPVAAKAPPPDQAGFEWGAAEVQVCLDVEAYLNNGPWRLVYADHTSIEASSVGYQQFPLPEYPMGDRDVAGGHCVRGWITYPAPKDKRPVTIEYAPQGFHAEWAVA